MSKQLPAVVLPTTAIEIFSCNKIEDIVESIEKQARSVVPDLSTNKGRKGIASNAASVSRSKITLDSIGKESNAERDALTRGVNIDRKFARDRLDALRDEIRQPLTDWEDAEKEREQAERDAAELAYDHEQALSENDLFNRQREVERKEAEQARIEQDRIDKEAAEKAETERKEYEARIAKEAEQRAQAEAKEAAERVEREAAEKIKAAEESAKQAEHDKIAAEERAKIQAENAERDKKEAADRARQAEIDRQADEKRIADAEQERLESNNIHVGNIRRGAKESLMRIVDEATAKRIVLAISKGEIENVTINY